MEYTDLNLWFTSRPHWIQKAFEVLINNKEFSEALINDLVATCKEEANGTLMNNSTLDLNVLSSSENEINIKLSSIENFKGINAIAPNQKIEFHQEKLTIIFGQNGTGKSGYVRTLKHACGAKNPGELHNNIFKQQSSNQECTINIKVNDSPEKIIWNKNKKIDGNLRHIHIYDTNAATAYVNEKNEVEYEPFLLQLFTSIIELCNKVKQKINEEKESKETALKRPKLPSKYAASSLGKWYESISVENTPKEIIEKTHWRESDERRLIILNKDLKKIEIKNKREKIIEKKREIGKFKDYLRNINEGLSYEKCEKYIQLQREIERKNDIILQDAEKVFSDSDIDGVATESWKLMWKYAREYSENQAYPKTVFPNISENARCVLCQQELDERAKKRMGSFNEYIASRLQRDLDKCKQQLEQIEIDFPSFDKEDTLLLRLRALNIDDSLPLYNEIKEFHKGLLIRKHTLFESKRIINGSDISIDQIISNLGILIDQFNSEDESLKMLEEGTEEDREIEKVNLECKKWLSDHLETIQNDLYILKDLSVLEKAIGLTRTTAYSIKKSELSEELVTESYINRFNEELKKLCNSKIKVTLVKDSTSRGRVFHKVILKDSLEKVNVSEILSEGEFRMVSLAAFLANVESESNINSPFIFDDPISSLDQTYEENTVKRLAELTKFRQVIVFTHRLSLCSMIEEELKKGKIESKFINLKRDSRGSGVPTAPPFITQSPLKAINSLLNDRIATARKIDNQDYELYELVVGGICKQVRIVTEHIIETNLLNQVVKRYRRSITTQNRMHTLALITADDCKYLDEVMTKFSVYEHSQPDESPATIPELIEIEEDIKLLKSWLENFLERQKQYEKHGEIK
jgi:energy-coupling factor transporter ATP-binding protein EcfA2